MDAKKPKKDDPNDDDPVVKSLIYLLIFVCLLEFWLSTGVIPYGEIA